MDDCCRKKERTEEEKKLLTNRLLRIEGQIRGIRGMLENDAYCIDIITQTAAVSAALSSFNQELLDRHIRTCVTEDIKAGNREKTEELLLLLRRLL